MPTSKSGSSSSRRSSGQTRRRSVPTPAGPTPEWEPVLQGDAGIIPGEVLLTLSPQAADGMTASVPLHPAGLFSSAANLGVDDLDSVLADLGAHDITRLAPSPVGIAGAFAADGAELGLLQEPDHTLSRTFRVRIDPGADVEGAVARLAGVDSVEVAEPNRWRETAVTPNDPQFGSQWGLTKINAPAAWDISTGSASVVVGIIDSGCDLDHPELAPLLVNGFDMVDLGANPTAPAGFRFEGDFAGRDAVPEDEVGHGTHVAGTIAAVSNNGVQVAGVGWQTRIMPIKALTRMVRISDGQVRGVGSSADVAAAVRWAADNGAHVINMSLGADAPTSVESSAVAYAIGKGVVVVAAMGNDGSANPSFPAAYPGVVAVGAIDSADKKASFSQTGSHISLAAPGVGILSTYLAGGTTTMSGTSMATPHVAGVAALIKAVKPSATGAEIADILRTTARPLRDAATDPVPNDAYGHGCLDAQAALVKARGPVINPTITVRLRTPLIACPPRTLLIRDCFQVTVRPPLCPPRTIQITDCLPRTVVGPGCPVTLPPTTTITVPPTTPIRTVPTQPVGRFTRAAGYDPYGLMGGAGEGTETAEGPYEAGYAAGYAAAMAEVEAAVAAAESESGETTGADVPNVAAGPGDVLQPFPFPRSLFVWCPPRTLTSPWCPPRTIGTPFCPIPTPTFTRTITTTPQWQQPGVGGFGYGEDWGYDPYGQSPFQG
ncbi:MAG TPA: S8 family serine peptidase [Microlunatus sp.]|nr:S8 family serine peptidase [Microlunatus sp.]